MAIAPEIERTERRLPLFSRRRTRRVLVGALAAICLLFILFPFVTQDLLTWLPPLVIVLIALMLTLNVFLRFATQWIAIAPDRFVDERQEAVRNTAYRLSHRVLAIAFGIPLWLVVSYVTSDHLSTAATGAANIGLVATYLELLYFTPTAVIAWQEPDAVTDEEDEPGFRLPGRVLVTLALIVLFMASPLVASAGLALPAKGESLTHLTAGLRPGTSCRYVETSEQLGTLVSTGIKMAGQVCWNGKRVWRNWGLDTHYCGPEWYSFSSNTMQCTAHFLPDHALDVRYQDTVRSPFLPALGRQVTLRLLVGPDGHIRALTHEVAAASTTVALPTHHVWRGIGNAGPLRFTMPVGGVPLVTSRPWHLTFHFTCPGLHHPKGLPPHVLKYTSFSLNLEGGSWGTSAGWDASYNSDRASRVVPMSNGGNFTLSITALPACHWTAVTA